MELSTFLESIQQSQQQPTKGGTNGSVGGCVDPPLPCPSNYIQFNNLEGLTSWALIPNAREFELVPSPGIATHSSPYLKLKSLVNSSWPKRSDPGRSVSVHKKGKYYAHVTAIFDQNETGVGAVRVVNRDTGERILIKGIAGKVADIAFAYLSAVIIGCIDEFGDLYIYSISEKSDKKLKADKILEIKYHRNASSKFNLLSWCPYIHDDEKSQEGMESSFLAISHYKSSEIISVKSLVREHGPGPLQVGSITTGRLKLEDRDAPITAIQISPDGTAVATAAFDGVVQFFQIYFASQEKPRCLHSWMPSRGKKEVSSLLFLDDLTGENRSVDFWSYAITGFNDNKELMLWCCNDWTCIQVVRIKSPGSELRASIDMSSRYLLLSDVVKMNLYVFRIEFDKKIRIVSVSEFATLNPFFSISIVDAGIKKLGDLHIKDTTLSDDDEFDEDDTPEVLNENSRESTVIQFYLAYPRGLQECRIVYNDVATIQLKEEDTIVSSNLEEEQVSKHHTSSVVTSSPAIPVSSLQQVHSDKDKDSSTSKLDTAAKQISLISPEMMNGTAEKQPPISGGSSPSREVQDILGDSNHDLCEDIVVTGDNCPYDDDDEEEDDEGVQIGDMLKQFQKLSKSVDWPSDMTQKNPSLVVLNKSFDPMMPTKVDCPPPQPPKESTATNPNLRNGDSLSNNATELLLKKMDELTVTVKKQNDEIKKLKEDIKDLKKGKPESKAIIQRFRDHEKFISTKIQTCIKGEMQTFSSNSANTYKKESKEALSKMVNSKPFLETLSSSLSESLQPTIQNNFKETFVNLVVPSFERSCQNLLSQISSTFNKGLRDYESTVRNHLKESVGTNQANLIREMKEGIMLFNSSVENNNLKKTEDNKKLLDELKKVITDAVTRTTTPTTGERTSSSSPDIILYQIKLLLNSSKFNDAFKMALSSNSLPIAVTTCQMVDPAEIFGEEKCPLEQSVILALIQHCATDLEEHTALKMKYLEEAIMNVDPNYPPLEANGKFFASKVVESMQGYINAHPNTKFSKSLKLRLMAVKSFIKD
ncbi:enhancer of mRNA-decapping protein 4 homolog [Lepeophtheirus salmonis]|uniref:enhancer of mRNA-decapping protein 4 homolog n=1 Tax=Lepeophtheirus salmonis TaxID=72036 RepID=UPI001AE975CF|nr:enhancer of mRNA-decapping protein 4-like [Lepeophtheirus salmonis]